jgi:hypothetical protein
MDYRELLSNFVDEEYTSMIDESALEYSEELSEIGKSPKLCVAVGLSETDNLGWTEVEIADELDISRKAVYNARNEIGLVEEDARGRHV